MESAQPLAAAFTLGDLAEKSYAEFGAPFGPETGFTVKLLAPKSTQHPAPQQPRPLHPRGPSVKQLPLAEDFNRLRSPDKYVLVYRPVGGGDWWERGPEFDTLSLGRFSLLVMLDGVHRMLLHPQGSSEPDDVRSDPANLR